MHRAAAPTRSFRIPIPPLTVRVGPSWAWEAGTYLKGIGTGQLGT